MIVPRGFPEPWPNPADSALLDGEERRPFAHVRRGSTAVAAGSAWAGTDMWIPADRH